MFKKKKPYFMDKIAPLFEKGGKYERFYPIFEMVDTILYTPDTVTSGHCHLRDGLDQKRTMITVVTAMIFPLLWGLYNIGYQVHIVVQSESELIGWRLDVMSFLNLSVVNGGTIDFMVFGALCFLPIFLVAIATGGVFEVLFSIIRRHEVTEGFLVTSFLIPLIVPPIIPLWQVAVATAFGVVVGKEIFGGVGFNILNPALTARAFLFFAYPAQISGDTVWVAVDGVSKATPLGVAALEGMEGLTQAGYNLSDAFLGFIPGSIGETSKVLILLGAAFLIFSKIGSWRVMVSVILGAVIGAFFLNLLSPYVENPMFALSPLWHLALGGLIFGAVYMATDPVTSSMTEIGKFIFGGFIGLLVIIIRVINPAYPEGVMLAILLMNVFAPMIDYFVVEKNIKKRFNNYNRSRKSHPRIN